MIGGDTVEEWRPSLRLPLLGGAFLIVMTVFFVGLPFWRPSEHGDLLRNLVRATGPGIAIGLWKTIRPLVVRIASCLLSGLVFHQLSRVVPLDPPGFFRGAMLVFAAFMALGVVGMIVPIARRPYLRLERETLRTEFGAFPYRDMKAIDVADYNGQPYVGIRLDEATTERVRGWWSRRVDYDMIFSERYGPAAELAARIRLRQQAARPDA